MVTVACFGVSVSVMFNLIFVNYTFSSVWVAEFLGNSCPLGWPYVLIVFLSICDIYLFPVLVLRAGFGI